MESQSYICPESMTAVHIVLTEEEKQLSTMQLGIDC
jgi:hypothetical protein